MPNKQMDKAKVFPNILALYRRRETDGEAALRRAKVGTIGGIIGFTVGTAAYFLRTQRLGKGAIGTGAFMGTIFGVGSLVKGWNTH